MTSVAPTNSAIASSEVHAVAGGEIAYRAWLLLAALLAAVVAGMLLAGSQPERQVPAVAPALACPSADEPALAGAETGAAGELAEGRIWHTASLLPGGCVLVVGGGDPRPGDPAGDAVSLATAELWDPACRCFRPAGKMLRGRRSHTATTLADGRVLVAGGQRVSGPSTSPPEVLAIVEIWDPARGVFESARAMSEGRSSHTATLLESSQVLVIGRSGAELWGPDPGTWGSAGALVDPRIAHTSTLLADGRVLVIGGHALKETGTGHRGNAPTAELWDPRTLAFEPAGAWQNPRTGHTATLLPDGRVLIVGGIGSDGQPVLAAEVWDPEPRSFALVGMSAEELFGHTATLLADGRVLLIGYQYADGDTGAMEFDPDTGAFSQAGPLINPRSFHTATQLPDGRILLIGGFGIGETLTRAELVDPSGFR